LERSATTTHGEKRALSARSVGVGGADRGKLIVRTNNKKSLIFVLLLVFS